MKKKFFGALVVVAIAVGAMINVNLNKVSNNGDLALANVETLAQGEDLPPVTITCGQYSGRCWAISYISPIGYCHCYFSGYQNNYCVEG
ncbi:MAG: NVEALA domain-containing protein [Paludibacter sp.]|jgi:hypothetical protein